MYSDCILSGSLHGSLLFMLKELIYCNHKFMEGWI